MASPSDAQEAPVAAVPPAQVQALAWLHCSQGEACGKSHKYFANGSARSSSSRCASNAGASVGLACIAIQGEACVATCTHHRRRTRRSPSSRGATSAGASVGLTCTAIQGEPALHLAQMPSPSDAQEVGRARSPSSCGAASAGASVGKTCTAIQGEPALQLAQMASPSDAQEGPVAAVPPAQVQALAYTLRWPFSQALMTAEYYMTSGRTEVCYITAKRSMACCHCWPASQAPMTAERE